MLGIAATSAVNALTILVEVEGAPLDFIKSVTPAVPLLSIFNITSKSALTISPMVELDAAVAILVASTFT